MADRESIKTKVWDENVGTLNSSKNDIDAQAEKDRQKQRQEAEAGINKVNGIAKEQSDSLYKDYDRAETLSAVQKIINERYIKRKMAEWGLSSSGIKDGNLKRAEQLSLKASNENRQIYNKGKTEINTWKQGQIAEIEKVRDGNIGVIDKNAADLKKQADDDFNKWVDAETNRQYSYAVEQEQKLLRQKNERIHAVSASIADLKGKLGGYLTEWAKWTCIQSHIEKYGVSDALINMLGGSGYGKDEALQKMTSFFNNKKVSDKYKIQRFVDYYKIYGMPSEEYIKTLTSGHMPGHNVTMSELKSALASIDETAYAKNRAIATNSEYDPFIYSGKKGAELLGQYEGYWSKSYTSKKEAEKLWKYATTPQLPKSATGRTPPYISSPTKKETNGLSFNPIAVTGAPYSKESGVKLVSPEAYDVIMQERERQNKLYEGAKSYDEYLEEHDLEEYKVTDKWSVQDREKLYTLFEKSPKEALSFAKTVNAELDKSAENVKLKAEESEKSSYEQAIDELAELLRERKDNKALSFWDKLESRVSTSDELETPKGEQTNKDWAVNRIVDHVANLGYRLNLDYKLFGFAGELIGLPIHALYKVATNLSSVDLLAQWVFGDGSDQKFGENSSLAKAFKKSDYMNAIIATCINEYKETGQTEFSGEPRITGFDEFDLWMGVRGFSYELVISERPYITGASWQEQEKTEYVVDVKIYDTYNFNSNKDSGDGVGSILNNFAYNLHEKGIGQDYFWELNYQDVIR